jgi:hypothetical protein
MLSTPMVKHRLPCAGLLLTGVMLLSSCSTETPEIRDTTVTPSSVALSTFESSVQFTIDTTILHLGDTITSVTANIEGETFALVEKGDVVGGQEWSITTTMTFWEGFSEGTYYIDMTAVSSDGETVTLKKAASVTVTS